MAGIGLQYSVYAPFTEDEDARTFEYGEGKRGRKMIKADVKINTTKSPLYGDDVTAEYAREFIDGDITINQDELTDTMRVDLLGNTKKSTTVGTETVEEIVAKDTDDPPYVGFGYVQTKIVDKVRQYRAVFYTKVQFGEPDDAAETKGQTINWQTPVIIGTIMRRVTDNEWRDHITVPSLATAIAWLKQKANIT